MGYMMVYPLVNIQKAIENGHRNSGFSHHQTYGNIIDDGWFVIGSRNLIIYRIGNDQQFGAKTGEWWSVDH